MIYATCPICLEEARIQILGKRNEQLAHIYDCIHHGLFAVSRSLDVQLRNLRSPVHVNHAHLIQSFEQRVLMQTRSGDGDLTHIPMFHSLED